MILTFLGRKSMGNKESGGLVTTEAWQKTAAWQTTAAWQKTAAWQTTAAWQHREEQRLGRDGNCGCIAAWLVLKL